MPFQKLIQKILTILPPEKWQRHTMILGVSGGADSVAMLRLFHRLTQEIPHHKIIVCHANHKLRGQESDEDQQFVQRLCQQLEIPFEVRALHVKEPARDGIESQLRSLRYQMFKELAGKLGARYVMTAHNANDQAETILFRILRGTGIGGLAGIPTSRPLCDGVSIIRPLLNISREEILHFLSAIEQEYRTDSSNQTNDYSRNKIRNQLIPLIQSEFGWSILDRLQPLAKQATEQQQLLDDICQPILDSAIRFSSNSFAFEPISICDHPPIVVRHLLVMAWKQMGWPLQAMTFDKWNQLANQLLQVQEKGQPSKLMLPGKIQFTADANEIRFATQ